VYKPAPNEEPNIHGIGLLLNDPRSPENIPEPEPAFFAANAFLVACDTILLPVLANAASAVIGVLLVNLLAAFDTSGEPLNKFP